MRAPPPSAHALSPAARVSLDLTVRSCWDSKLVVFYVHFGVNSPGKMPRASPSQLVDHPDCRGVLRWAAQAEPVWHVCRAPLGLPIFRLGSSHPGELWEITKSLTT